MIQKYDISNKIEKILFSKKLACYIWSLKCDIYGRVFSRPRMTSKIVTVESDALFFSGVVALWKLKLESKTPLITGLKDICTMTK